MRLRLSLRLSGKLHCLAFESRTRLKTFGVQVATPCWDVPVLAYTRPCRLELPESVVDELLCTMGPEPTSLHLSLRARAESGSAGVQSEVGLSPFTRGSDRPSISLQNRSLGVLPRTADAMSAHYVGIG